MLDERGACLGAEPLHDVEDARRQADLVARRRANSCAESGVSSDGFRTAPLPQKIAGNTFQATFGSGVLNEISSPATPTGCRTAITVRCGMLAVVVRP